MDAEEAHEPSLVEANAQRILHLRNAGKLAPAQVDLMYAVSLLEFLIGPERLGEANDYHQHRIAIHLAEAEASLEVQEEQARAAAARSRLMGR